MTIDLQSLADLAQAPLIQNFTSYFDRFVLVMARFTGLMAIGPILGQAIVPARIRVMLVVALSFTAASVLPVDHQPSAVELDRNQDGYLDRAEVPDVFERDFVRALRSSEQTTGGRIEVADFKLVPVSSRSSVEYFGNLVAELAMGLVLGLSVYIILSGLQLAGQLIDQQIGIALGQVFRPDAEFSNSPSGQLLYFLGLVILLTMKPISGHLLMVSALLETFHDIPPGYALISPNAVEFIEGIVHQSLVLAFQVAAPVLATMSLLALAMGYLGRTIPQVNVLVIGFPLRIILSLIVLATTLSGASATILDAIQGTLTGVGQSFR